MIVALRAGLGVCGLSMWCVGRDRGEAESHSRAQDNVVGGAGGGWWEWGGECVVCGVCRRGVCAGMRAVCGVHLWLWVSQGTGVAHRHS